MNGPESLCMKARMCDHIETNQKSKKKNTKKEISDSCECNAIHVVNGVHYCKKHYEHQQQQTQNDSASVVILTIVVSEDVCGVIVKSGKIKGCHAQVLQSVAFMRIYARAAALLQLSPLPKWIN